jgi:CHAT domain-containing protein/tetratricopeptide (TPR) repeat protein
MYSTVAVLLGVGLSLGVADRDDEKAVRTVVERFFAVYAKKDLDGFMALWSEKAPDYATRKQTMQRVFAETGDITLKELTIIEAETKGDAARVRVRVELVGADKNSGKLHSSLGKFNRLLLLGRQDGAWKVLRYGPAEDELLARLLAADGKDAREKLYRENKDLVGRGLMNATNRRTGEEWRRNRLAVAMRINDLALEIGERLADKEVLGASHEWRGILLLTQGKHADAEASFKQALQLFREAKDSSGEAGALNSLGNLYINIGRHAEALRTFEKSMKICQELKDRKGVARALLSMGIVCKDTAKYKEALEYYQESLKIHRELKDREWEAKLLANIGVVYVETGRFAEGLRHYQDSLKIMRELDYQAGVASLLMNIGNIYGRLERNAEALEHYRESLKINRALGDRRAVASVLQNLANLYRETGRGVEALENYQEALKIARDLNNRYAEANALTGIGMLDRKQGRYEEALKRYREALKINRDLGRRAEIVRDNIRIGVAYEHSGRYNEALQAYQDSLKLARAIGARSDEADALNNLGHLHMNAYRHTEALQCLQDSLKSYRDLGSRTGEARVLDHIGSDYFYRGRFAEALHSYETALKIHRELKHRKSEGGTLTNIGLVYADTGRFAEALRSYQETLTIYQELDYRQGVAEVQEEIGRIYARTGRHDEALKHYQDSLKVQRELKNRKGVAGALNSVANEDARLGRHEEALEFYQESLKIGRELDDSKVVTTALNNIAALYRKTKRDKEAMQLYEESLKIERDIDNQQGVALTLYNIGVLHALKGQSREALEKFQESVRIAEAIGDLRICYSCEQYRGSLLMERGELAAADKACDRAIAFLEQLRANTREPSLQTSFFADNAAPYYWQTDIRLKRDLIADAFTSSESLRSRTMIDLLSNDRIDLDQRLSKEERGKEQQLQDRMVALGVRLEESRAAKAGADRIRSLEKELSDARAALEQFRVNMYVKYFQTGPAKFAPADLSDLNKSLFASRPGLVVLSYLIRPKQVLLFVLTRGNKADGPAKLTAHRIDVDMEEVAEAVGKFRTACLKPGVIPSSDDLYRWLLAPVEETLDGAKHVVIVPDGVLQTLPFQALRADEDSKYLVERAAVSYAPSVTALLKMQRRGDDLRKQHGKEGDLLALGIRDFGKREKTLPQAEDEARAIAKLFGDSGHSLLGTEATPSRLRARWSKARYLHFATHGLLNEDAPFYSSLVLSPDQEKGAHGQLFAADLLEERLSAEVAVLSACETGLGRRYNGEGLLGLSWAWFVAGVPSLVVSQWSVSDQAAERLMTAFWSEVKSGTPRAEALRRAQLRLLKDRGTRHPFYWAPFVLVGDFGDGQR